MQLMTDKILRRHRDSPPERRHILGHGMPAGGGDVINVTLPVPLLLSETVCDTVVGCYWYRRGPRGSWPSWVLSGAISVAAAWNTRIPPREQHLQKRF